MDDYARDKWTRTILFVLDILQQISDSGGKAPQPSDFRERLELQLSGWGGGPSASQTDRLIQAALVYWSDEVLINSGWEYSQAWSAETLEQRFLHTRARAWRFYANARQAHQLTDLAAFEVYAVTAALGFRGVYRHSFVGEELPELAEPESEEVAQCAAATTDEQMADAEAAASSSPALQTVPPCNSSDSDFVPARTVASKMPPTFSQWAQEAFSLLVQEDFPPFDPISPLGAAQAARPLWGTRALWIWSTILVGSVLAAGLINLGLGG